jgi:hypothetical protein
MTDGVAAPQARPVRTDDGAATAAAPALEMRDVPAA